MGDIHAIVEIFDAADAACDAMVSAAADGKLTILDARFLITPVRDAISAVKDLSLVSAEVKALDDAAMSDLIVRAVALVQKVTLAVEAMAGLSAPVLPA